MMQLKPIDLEDVKTGRIKELLSACKELQHAYVNKIHTSDCPFCKLLRNEEAGCRLCPWLCFTGLSCSDYVRKKFVRNPWQRFDSVAIMRETLCNVKWNEMRIRQLEEWIKGLQEIIDRRV